MSITFATCFGFFLGNGKNNHAVSNLFTPRNAGLENNTSLISSYIPCLDETQFFLSYIEENPNEDLAFVGLSVEDQ